MPVTVKFVVVEKSHTCVSVNLKSQREKCFKSCKLVDFFYLPQQLHLLKFKVQFIQWVEVCCTLYRPRRSECQQSFSQWQINKNIM